MEGLIPDGDITQLFSMFISNIGEMRATEKRHAEECAEYGNHSMEMLHLGKNAALLDAVILLSKCIDEAKKKGHVKCDLYAIVKAHDEKE